jgi:hypothetical protein
MTSAGEIIFVPALISSTFKALFTTSPIIKTQELPLVEVISPGVPAGYFS